jgi:hypothetical protein
VRKGVRLMRLVLKEHLREGVPRVASGRLRALSESFVDVYSAAVNGCTPLTS